jgi:succinate dehydrogenase/fumarate reductase cytochrome b subunit
VSGLRIVHGVTALCLLCGFLIAHLINHDLAVWSVQLHGDVMTWLRLWYRSEWVEPALLGLMFVMICTGIPMVVHYARQRMDAFRVIQTATGVYVAVFLCSHVLAVLRGRSVGVETDWSFAAGLLDGVGLRNRLIPHYFFAAFFLLLHVACGLRIVLLKHGVAKMVGNRALYALTVAAVLVTLLSTAALLGFHMEGS